MSNIINNIQDLLSVFEVTYALMSCTTQLSPTQLDQFEYLCKQFGIMWRTFFPGSSITPKMHLLESHAPVQMRMFGCLGDKIEAAVERLHHICNKSNRILAAMRDYAAKTNAMLDRRELALSPEVQSAIDRALRGTSRLFSPEAQGKRAQISTDKSTNKRHKLENAIITADLIDDFIEVE